MPDYLYHYTSINALGFILKNQTIRFNNLTAMDDLDEGYYENATYGQYVFVSSWTDEVTETIPMWNMYSNDMNGVRIKLAAYPFKEYTINETCFMYKMLKDVSTGQVKAVFPEEELDNGLSFRCRNVLLSDLLHKVQYQEVEHVDRIRMQPVFSKLQTPIGMATEFHLNRMGKYKSSYWSFQKEWRYILYFIPHTYSDIQRLKPLPFSDYYLKIDDAAFESMEIVIGPKANEIDQEIVRVLTEKYNPTATVRLSELHGRIG